MGFTPGNTVEPSDEMLVAIGSFSLNWSVLEMGWDYLAALVWHQFEGGKTVERESPKMISRKLSFLRTCTKKLPGFALLSNYVTPLLDETEALLETRTHIAHGAVHAVDKDGSLRLVRLVHDKAANHSGFEIRLTFDEVAQGAIRAREAAHKVVGLGLFLSAPPEDEINQPLGK
jgi:hypothetical protein